MDAVLTCILFGYEYIAVGNERSANYGNGIAVGDIEVSFAIKSTSHPRTH